MVSDPTSNLPINDQENDDITVTIQILGRQFDFIAVTETPALEPVYLYTVVIRVYGYNKATTLIAIPFLKRPSKILFQLNSRRGNPVGLPIPLEQLIPSNPNDRATVVVKKGENK
jgi:hypothetical protein